MKFGAWNLEFFMLIGHQRIWNFLIKSAENERLAHAYLFIGKQILHQISLSPFCAPRKIVIIDEAQQMTLEAANCLLKTLEEPPPKSLLILISSNSQRILPTIISRCQLIKFLPVKARQIAEGLKTADTEDRLKIAQILKLACGRPGAAINLLSDSGLQKTQERVVYLENLQRSDLVDKFKYAQKLSQDIPTAHEILSDWLIWFRDRILENAGAKSLIVFERSGGSSQNALRSIKNILGTQRLLSESGLNHRLVLENLMLKI